jgi:RNA polymerase sigma-70 factor (ECF subfamily)
MDQDCQAVANDIASFDDNALVRMAKVGEHAAYAELSKRHSNQIFRTLLRITKNREDAEDAMQETLMKAFVHLRTFDGRSSVSTWLTRIAINSALMLLRKRRPHLELSLDSERDDQSGPAMQVLDMSADPETLYARQESGRHLRRAIRRLSPQLRLCIEIQHTRDASVREVAEIAGLSTSATKSRLLRARRSVISSLSKRSPHVFGQP